MNTPKKRAIVTLATGSQYYYRMALALMISARKFGGERYDYIIFSDKEKLPYYKCPDWLKVVKLSERYFNRREGVTSKGEGFRIKSMILSDDVIREHDVLFLDADCFVFQNCFEDIFQIIEKNSLALYGSYLPEGELWGKLDFPGVAAKAGLSIKNMWINSGFIGRAANELGLLFVQQYESLMREYPFRPYIQSKFWQSTDEPYLAAAFQLAYLTKNGALPEQLPSPSSDLYITTYDAKLEVKGRGNPIVHSNYVKGVYQPAVIHFLGGIDMPYYRSLINRTVEFDLTGTFMRPYFRGNHVYKKLKYFYKRLTDKTVTEARDA